MKNWSLIIKKIERRPPDPDACVQGRQHVKIRGINILPNLESIVLPGTILILYSKHWVKIE